MRVLSIEADSLNPVTAIAKGVILQFIEDVQEGRVPIKEFNQEFAATTPWMEIAGYSDRAIRTAYLRLKAILVNSANALEPSAK